MALRITGSVIGEPITSSSSSATGMWLSQEVAALQQDGIWQIAPGFTLTSSAATVNEGASITITLTTTGILNGTAIPYVISGANIFANDSANGVITGNFVIQNNSNTISFAANADLLTEGSEAFTITAGGASTSVTINDTSTTPVDAQFPYTTLALHGNGTNNSQNNTFLDSSTNNFSITRNGNSTQGTFSPYGGNWSNYFDGTGDSLTISSSSAFAYGTGAFTVEFWVYSIGTAAAQVWVINSGLTLNIQRSTGGVYNVYDGTDRVSSTAVIPNIWNHVAVVRTGTGTNQTNLYVNGVSVLNWTNTVNYAADNFAISGSASFPCTCYISNLRVVKGTAVYTSTFTPPTAPLTAIAGTSLLTCQDNRLIDDSPNNFTITKAGDVSVQRFSPFSPLITTPTTYSAYFDGTGDYLTVPAGTAFAPGTGDFTVEGWYYSAAASGNQQMWAQTTGGSDYFVVMFTPATSQFRFIGNGVDAFSTAIATPNIWNHFAVVRVGTSVTVYCNGVAGTPVTFTDNFSNTSYVPTISGYTHSATNMLTGYLSNLRYVKGVAVYTGTFTVPTSPLTATQSSGTNIAAITGTATSLLTCQSPTFIDNSTNAFTITANGDSRPTTVNPFGVTNTSSEYSTTTFGGSGYLDGTGDYLSIPANAGFTFGTNDHTIEFYYYLPSTSLASGYATQWKYSSASTQQATNDYYFQIGTAGGSNIGLLLGGGGSWGILIQPSVSINAFVGVWTHIAWTRSGNTFRLFFNGVQVGTGTYAGSISAQSNPMLLGQEGAGSYAGGYYSNFRVNNGTALYKANFAPPIAPVTAVANTSVLLNFTNAGIIDNAMMTNLETVADAKISTVQSKYGTSSMYFDGTGDYLSIPNNPSLNLSSGDWTIEAWVYQLVNTAGATIVEKDGVSGSSYVQYSLGCDGGGKFTIDVGSGNGTSYIQSINASGFSNQINTWYHLAAVKSGTTITLYIDGINRASATQTGTMVDGGKVAMVGYQTGQGSGSYWNGYIDDLRITKGYARYTSNFTPPTEFANK
jgi:hypothetical protein